jgi:hypothetical protein
MGRVRALLKTYECAFVEKEFGGNLVALREG